MQLVWRQHRRRAAASAGFTLIEILVSLAIVSVVSVGAVMGFRSLLKSELRSAAGKLAAAIRYSYDRAISTGSYYRLHFNLDDQTYRLERSETRVLLQTSESSGRNGRGEDKDVADRQADEDEQRSQGSGLPPELLPPPSPRRPKFAEYKDSTLPTVKLGHIRLLDVLTPRQSEPYVSGHAYMHFFPDGHAERAVIHLTSSDDNHPSEDDQYTLIVHGLTGRVEVLPGRVPPPPDFNGDNDARSQGGS